MGLNLSTLRASVYRITGTDSDDADQTLVDDVLNRSWWEIMAKFDFREKEIAANFSVLAGQAVYDMPDPFDAVKSIAIIDSNGKSIKLDRKTSDWYETVYDSSVTAQAIPTDYFRENSVVTLYPTPDQDYIGVLRYLTNLADLSNTNTTLVIPQEWHEIILYGACWRLLLELGDFNRANAIKKEQIELISTCSPTEVQEEVDSRLSGVDFIGSKYEL